MSRVDFSLPGARSRILLVFLLTMLAAALPALASGENWLRYPALSPDGQTIAFSWRGDLWTVPAAGGEARPLTSHEGYEAWPVWSPDSRQIAFASDRYGQLDVFLIDAAGGPTTRLTFHSSDDTPTSFTPDGSRVFFSSSRQHAPQALLGSGRRFEELYSIPTAGGAPRQELTTPADAARISPDGRFVVYEDVKAYENEWRKHHTSSAARDIWLWDRESGHHERLTTFAGEDRQPVWLPGGDIAFLSEKDGTLDVYRLALDSSSDPVRVSGEPMLLANHGPHPVRFLSSADDGTLAYGYDGGIYTLATSSPGSEPRRVEIDLRADERSNPVLRKTYNDEVTEIAVSPHGDEVAFVVRGEIFLASAEHGTTRRLTETPEQERSLTWAPDGRRLYFAGERGGSWNLYSIGLADPEEKRFFEATAFDPQDVLVGPDEDFQPVMSPGGKHLAFLHNRDEIRLLNLETGEQKTMVPAERNYSYADGDIGYTFSPDGKWLAATYYPFKRWIGEVAVVELATGEVHNTTVSGYDEGAPKFTADGESLLFLSDRQGLRSHGGWGGENDLYALSLNREAYDRARLSVEEYERLQADKKRGEKKDDEGDGKDSEKAEQDDKPIEPIDPIDLDTDDMENRQRRLSVYSALIADYAASKDGEVIFLLARVEDSFDLFMVRPRYGESVRLAELGDEEGGSLQMSPTGDALFILTGDGRVQRLEVEGLLRSLQGGNGDREGGGERGGPRARPMPVPLRAEMTVDTAAERQYLFDHVWRQVKDKFYVEDLHGADWPALEASYARFLGDLRHSRDFAELLSEMLGELNASHTGARYRPRGDADSTASLGLLYDPAFEGPGLRIAEVLKNGPADVADSRLGTGVVITKIDGQELTAAVNPWSLLDRKAGDRVRLSLRSPKGETFEEVVKPVPGREEERLRYEHWMQRLRDMTDQLSGGRIGYVHVEGMNDSSFRHFQQEVLGRLSDKEALIVDTRYNGGGWLHDDLAAFLQGVDYLTVTPRDKEPGSFGAESFRRWTRPVAVVQNEANYSDAFIFPWVFKELKLGTLVGMPVAGTGTAVWWERLIDPDLVFGIPQVGMIDRRGTYMENFELEPDIEVRNDPESVARGEDKQLAAAVKVLLEQLNQAAN